MTSSLPVYGHSRLPFLHIAHLWFDCYPLSATRVLTQNGRAKKQAFEKVDRDELLGAKAHVAIDIEGEDGSTRPHAQAQKLLSQTERLAADQQRLEESHRVALETGQVGSGILEDLRSQRERLESTRDNVRHSRVAHCAHCSSPNS